MSIADKLKLIASNVQKVFDSGKKAEYDAFWDAFQENGNRKNYGYAFAGVGWYDETFKPKYNITIKTGSNYMFGSTQITDLCKLLKDNNVELTTTGSTGATCYAMFSGASKLLTVPALDFSTATSTQSIFGNCRSLKSIEKIIISETNTNVGSMFLNCTSLESVIFEGTLACSGLDVSACTKLTVESLRSILRILSTNGSGKAITLATVHQAIIESDTECIQYATAAKNAGWTIAYN